MRRGTRRGLRAGDHGIALGGSLLVAALALLALLAPVLLPGSPTEISKDQALRGPTAAEPFGMDDLGRSVLSRVIHAYRVSLGVAIAVGLPGRSGAARASAMRAAIRNEPATAMGDRPRRHGLIAGAAAGR